MLASNGIDNAHDCMLALTSSSEKRILLWILRGKCQKAIAVVSHLILNEQNPRIKSHLLTKNDRTKSMLHNNLSSKKNHVKKVVVFSIINRLETKAVLKLCAYICISLTLLEPQSRFGGILLKFQVGCPQNGTAVL